MLSDGSTIVIGANSRVVIKELNTLEVTKVSTSTFGLLKGKIRAIVVPLVSKDSRFTIETGNATVGVRGTDFGVTRDPDAGTTHLLALDGAVYLTPTYFPDLPPIFVVGGERDHRNGRQSAAHALQGVWRDDLPLPPEDDGLPTRGKEGRRGE